MNKKTALTALAFLFSVGVGAQTIYDAANLSDKDLNGTARFVGMGGAMSALGGDLSTIGTNPAGIGIYRSNDAAISFGLSSFGTESNYMGSRMNSDKMRGDLNSAGFVLSTKFGNATTLRYINFGFNYQRVKSFYKNMEMGGNLGGFSQTYSMANQAAGIDNWGSDPYNDAGIGWLSVLGYDGFLITDILTESQSGGISNRQPYLDDGGQQISSLPSDEYPNGELMYRTPGHYVGMYNNAAARFRSQERGGIDQYDFNISFNVNDRAYFGVTIGAYTVDYSKYSFYDEDYGGGEGYNLQTWSKVEGTGFDVKFGTIVRPFEYSPLRIGLAIHTPTFYRLDYKTNARLESDVLNTLDADLQLGDNTVIPSGEIGLYTIDTYETMGDMVRQFELRTPWTYNISLGYTVGSNLALGAEYEYKDYSSVKFRDDQGYSDTFGYENATTGMLKGVSTLRIGAEYKPVPSFAIRAGYNFRSAIFKDDAYKDLPINSIQTDTDFSNSGSLSNYTLGIGYRGSMFYADLAYKYTTCKSDFYPFDMYDGQRLVQATKVTDTRSQVLLTLGVRF